MAKEDFKRFVRSNPNLINYVSKGEKTWQDFYEMYDIYGENSNVWDKYKDIAIATTATAATVGDTSLKDLFNMIKKIDLDSVKKGAEGLQKAISLVQDFTKPSASNTYQARPLYQHFED